MLNKESINEKISEEITKRNMHGMHHMVLQHSIAGGIGLLINSRLISDFQPTKNVHDSIKKTIMAYSVEPVQSDFIRMKAYTIPASNRIVWPRSARNDRMISTYALLDTKIMRDDSYAILWTVYAPSRTQDGDVWYYLLSFDPKYTAFISDLLTFANNLLNEVNVNEKRINIVGGSDLVISGTHNWEDLVLSPDVVRSVKDDLEFWINSESLYREKHIPYRRGYLFEGPPGNGKTATIRVILSTYDFAGFGFNFSNPRFGDAELQNMFSNAASCAPSLIILEDLDRLFADKFANTLVTREGLFNCLDGVATFDGVVVIATANHPENLDRAIRQRPGRFDVPVRFSNPSKEQRLAYLKKLLGTTHEVSENTLEGIAVNCSEFSMAFIKLIYEAAAIEASKASTELTIGNRELIKAFEQTSSYYSSMETSKERSAGFQKTKHNKAYDDERSIHEQSYDAIEDGNPNLIAGATTPTTYET